jgi:DNA-binding MarR family transcriptional regulator
MRHGYGLIEHRENDTDRRVKMLYLTRTGQQMVEKILAAITAAAGGNGGATGAEDKGRQRAVVDSEQG